MFDSEPNLKQSVRQNTRKLVELDKFITEHDIMDIGDRIEIVALIAIGQVKFQQAYNIDLAVIIGWIHLAY